MKHEGNANEEKFREAYLKMKERGLLQRLEEKYRDKPFFEEYKEERQAVLAGSYLANGVSIALGFYFVYQLAVIFSYNVAISVIIAVILLSVWELAKRGFLAKAMQKRLANGRYSKGWIAVILLIAGSMCFSFLGGKDLMEDYTYNPEFIAIDSLSNTYNTDIAALEAQKAGLVSQQNEKGQTYYKLIDEIAALDIDIAEMRKDKNAEIKKAKINNAKEKAAVTVTTAVNGFWFGCAGAVMDILLMMCIWFVEYYDDRSFKEYQSMTETLSETPATLKQSSRTTITQQPGQAASDTEITPASRNKKSDEALLTAPSKQITLSPKAITATTPEAVTAGGTKEVPALFIKNEDGQKLIRHFKQQEGVWSYFSENQVKANLSSWRSRYKTSKQVYNDSRDDKDQSTMNNRYKKMQYWADLLSKFD